MRRLRQSSPGSSTARHGIARRLRSIRDLGLTLGMALAATTAGHAQFSDISASLTGVHHGASVWGDYDGDGKLDVLLTGQTTGGSLFSDIFHQDAGWAFNALGAGLEPVAHNYNNRSAWGDYDNDGDLDVVITGYSYASMSTVTKLYNNNAGTFTEVTSTSFLGVGFSTAAWADYDNDGDLDLLLAGHSGGSPVGMSTVYRNDGAASGFTFTNVAPTALGRAGFAEGAWGDYDKDGDLDLIVMGYTLTGIEPKINLYRNDGAGQLANSGISFFDLAQGDVAWGDYDNDGDLDLAMIGTDYNGSYNRYFKLYRNNYPTLSFTSISTSVMGYSDGSVAWGDCNNDGKLDLLVTGYAGSGMGTPFMQVLTGNGAGSFTDIGFSFPGVYDSEGSWGDFDNDGRLDVLVGGRINSSTSIAKIFRNTITGTLPNNAPSSPTGLSATSVSWQSMKLQWNAGTDIETPQAALTYNLRVVDNTTGATIMPGMANTSTGERHLPAMGNTNQTRSWTIEGLTPGNTYKVYVQTIDNELKASGFSPALTVTLPTAQPLVMIGDCIADAGAEPNLACGGVSGTYWNSPNIYIRTAADGHLPGNDVTQRPSTAPGANNYVYVKIKNYSGTTLPEGRLHVYFAKASTGLAWPTNWSGFYPGGAVKGDFVGQADVTNILPGETRIVGIRWNNVPSDINSFTDHFCLLARFVSGADPMAAEEEVSVFNNTMNNHNIAWRNISRFDNAYNQGDVIVRNTELHEAEIDLGFGFHENSDYGTALNYCTVQVKLPREIMQLWISRGSRGEGIQVVDDRENGQVIRFRTPNARIMGIPLKSAEEFVTRVQVMYPGQWPDYINNKSFFFDMAQYTRESQVPVGGETYEVIMTREKGRKTVISGGADLSGMLELNAHPNPTSSSATISYTLPADSRVTLSLYDAAGRLVRTLVDGAQQDAGRHTIEWNGMNSGGEAAASGTYFYRVETGEGSGQGQIMIAR